MIRLVLLAFSLSVMSSLAGQAQDKSAAPQFYEDDVANSNPLRAEQARELDAYIVALKQDRTRLQKVLAADYSSPAAFEKSTQAYRQEFCASIG